MLSVAACFTTGEAAAELHEFTQMLLSIGDGTYPTVPDQLVATSQHNSPPR